MHRLEAGQEDRCLLGGIVDSLGGVARQIDGGKTIQASLAFPGLKVQEKNLVEGTIRSIDG